MAPISIGWKDDVDPHDFDAAYSYLTLLLDKKRAVQAVHALKDAKLTTRRANDILRACHREPLPLHDPGVAHARDKADAGKKLSPILVVSFEFGGDIADGYHRVSLAYNADPFADVPLRLAAVVH